VHVSKLWGGSASDVHITRNSGLLEQIEPGDAVMIDKGFIQLKSDLEKKNKLLFCFQGLMVFEQIVQYNLEPHEYH
jgi:pyruvate kinase